MISFYIFSKLANNILIFITIIPEENGIYFRVVKITGSKEIASLN